jgi:hypothetical protein
MPLYRAETPVLREELSREITSLGDECYLTLEGRLLMVEQERAFSRERMWSGFSNM